MSRAEYRLFQANLWDRLDFQQLTPLERLVLLTLKGRCGPAGIRQVPGLIGALVDWTGIAEVEPILSGLTRKGWIFQERNVVWIIGALADDPNMVPKNPKHQRCIQDVIDALPALDIVSRFCTYYSAWKLKDPTKGIGMVCPKVSDTSEDTFAKGIGIKTPKVSHTLETRDKRLETRDKRLETSKAQSVGSAADAADTHRTSSVEVSGTLTDVTEVLNEAAQAPQPAAVASESATKAVAKESAETAAAVEAVYRFWQTETGYTTLALTAWRRRLLVARLKRYSVEQLETVIRWAIQDPWMNGTDARASRAYLDFDTLFGSDKKVDRYLATAETSRANPRTSRRLAATAEIPETRRL